MKRNESLVLVISPTGEEMEVRQRNATDLVQNLGWHYPQNQDATDALAKAPRTKGQRSSKVQAAREEAARVASKSVEREPAAKEAAKRGRKPKAVSVDLTKEEDDIIPVDKLLEDEIDEELAALEAEEDARGKY